MMIRAAVASKNSAHSCLRHELADGQRTRGIIRGGETGLTKNTKRHSKHATHENHPARGLGHSLSPSVLTIVMVSVYDSEET